MKTTLIRHLVENYTIDQLIEAEKALVEGGEPAIELEGRDASEKLTYLLASVYVLERVKAGDADISGALQQYTLQVRAPI